MQAPGGRWYDTAMRVLLSFLTAAMLFAQEPPPAPQPAKPKRMPEPRNLQVLKVAPGELIGLMRSYNVALGVQCTFCHIQGNFASDDNPHKQIARRMIRMNQEINQKISNPDGTAASADVKTSVSCYTCHRGEEHPKVTAPAAESPAGGAGGPAGAPPPPPAR